MGNFWKDADVFHLKTAGQQNKSVLSLHSTMGPFLQALEVQGGKEYEKGLRSQLRTWAWTKIYLLN